MATAFLTNRSKDLRIAAILVSSLTREDGFSGLAAGLELVHNLLAEYGDSIHPGPDSTPAVLDWLVSEDVAFSLYLVPITVFGHDYHHYQEWQTRGGEEDSEENRGPALPTAGVSAANFEQGFGDTAPSWYAGLHSSLKRAEAALDNLAVHGPDGRTRSFNYSELGKALRSVGAAVSQLLERKGIELPSETPFGLDEDGEGANAHDNGSTVEPRSEPEAIASIVAAARVLRLADPSNPLPYLLTRALRWGELRGKERLDLRDLEAPTQQQRIELRTLLLDQQWEQLLVAAEEAMETPVGRGWLDLQRYTVLAADRLGDEYAQVARALRGALAGLIVELPELVQASLMDDTATCSRDTLFWMDEEGILNAESRDFLARLDAIRLPERSELHRSARVWSPGSDRAVADVDEPSD